MKDYDKKEVEWRKEYLIDRYFSGGESVLDLGCGAGQYGSVLKKKFGEVYGVEKDIHLASIAVREKRYHAVRVDELKDKLPSVCGIQEFHSIWSSELLEHLPNLNIVLDMMAVSRKKLIITMPNPRSPHFKEDKGHILKYSINGLKKFFDEMYYHDLEMSYHNGHYDSGIWEWKVRGLGIANFRDKQLPPWVQWLTMKALWFFPELSPTVVVIGRRRA